MDLTVLKHYCNQVSKPVTKAKKELNNPPEANSIFFLTFLLKIVKY